MNRFTLFVCAMALLAALWIAPVTAHEDHDSVPPIDAPARGAQNPNHDAAPVHADDGHDHAHAPSAPAAEGMSPRFEAHSQHYEAVGLLQGDELSVMVDRYATNEPVLDAQVALKSGTIKSVGQFHADHGDYSFSSQPFAKPGTYPIALTIRNGDHNETLSGELVVPATEANHAHADGTPLWVWWSLGIGALLLAALALGLRMRSNTRNK